MWDKPRVLNWIANFLNALAAVMFLYGLGYVVVHLPIFPLKEVRVEGQLEHVTREQIKLIVDRHLQGNFFTVDVVKARDAFQKLPWARKVSVRKRWPDRLEVVVEEQHELARWGNIALVNSYGELFHAASDSDLPVFYGPGDGVAEVAKHYGVYSQILAGGTGMRITQLALTPRRAWQIRTDKGLVIELGREQMEERLQKFASVYNQTLGGLKVAITYADLRYPNGFAVRKPEAAAPKRKTGAA
ncbi:cell division protein FtsQ/DivIB [Methylobacillus arboreus]|uniref:cell division protein FtsQ/DivIB n=1 Tax=Methylobacillus arboreus TaxID=755170 RepID=UPI001E4D4CC7|nr:cell division protein FtsQ/DivIB [Methylobacillus arboreus]MCB5190467.1 cell division protein FtsQ/DivIB [Methylobacillus arboreus]